MGRARCAGRAAGGRLLAGAGAERDRPRARFGRTQAFRRRAGELRLGGAVPHGRHHAGGGTSVRCGRSGAAAAGDDRGRRAGGVPARHRPRCGGGGGCRRVLRPAAQPAGTARSRRPARRTADHGAAARGHQPAGEAGRRPHGPDGADRGRRRDAAGRHVLLPELRARDGGGERLAAARHQFRQVGQYPGRLRLPPGAGVNGSLRDAACTGRLPS